jgi:hypothetical protein
MFWPYDSPKKRALTVFERATTLNFVTYGIVNPMGPTLCGILLALDPQHRTSEVLSFFLNPFEQGVEALGDMELPQPNELVDDVETIIKTCNLFSDAVFTLVIPSRRLPSIDHTRRIVTLLLSRNGRLGPTLKLLREFPANPWDRITKMMAMPREETVGRHEGSNWAEAVKKRLYRTKGSHQPAPSDFNSDLQEFVSLILDPRHLQEESKAFRAAWEGAIKFARGPASETMSVFDFVTISGKILGAPAQPSPPISS